MQAEVIETDEGFEQLKSEWDGVLADSRQDSPFLTHGWLSRWWQTHEPAGRLHVLSYRSDEGKLVGVAPTFSARRGRLVPVRVGRLLGDRGVGSTGLGAFALPEAEDEVFDRFADYVRNGHHGWDVVDLDFVDSAGTFYKRMAAEPGARVDGPSGRCPQAPLPPDWDSFVASWPSRRRSAINRHQRKLKEHGVELEIISEAEELPGAIDDLLRLHEQRMRAKLGGEFSVSPQFREFTSLISSDMLAQGRLQLIFLRLGDERIAVAHQFVYRNTIYAQQCAFEPVEGLPQLMRPLIGSVIRDAIERGCTHFDMLLGEQKYKFEWGVTHVREYSRVQVYGATVAARARRARDQLVSVGRGPRLTGSAG